MQPVKVTYETTATANAAYLQYAEGPIGTTVDTGCGILLDLDADGRLMGVEILDANLEDLRAAFPDVEIRHPSERGSRQEEHPTMGAVWSIAERVRVKRAEVRGIQHEE